MIIVNDNKEAAKEILASRFGTSHVILNFDHIGLGYHGNRMKYAIDILDLIFFYCRVQKMYNDLGFKEKIDYSILYEVIDHVLKEEPFNDSQLIRFYELKKVFETITEAMNTLLNEDDYYLDYDVDFTLLGLTVEELRECTTNDKGFEGELHENFGKWIIKYDREGLAVKDLIKSLKTLIQEVKVKAAAQKSTKQNN